MSHSFIDKYIQLGVLQLSAYNNYYSYSGFIRRFAGQQTSFHVPLITSARILFVGGGHVREIYEQASTQVVFLQNSHYYHCKVVMTTDSIDKQDGQISHLFIIIHNIFLVP